MASSSSSSSGPPRAVWLGIVAVVGLAAATWVLGLRARRLRDENARLRATLGASERERSSLAAADSAMRRDLTRRTIRQQAITDSRLHLSIVIDSSLLVLQREGRSLRTIALRVPTGTSLAVGVDAIERVTSSATPWTIPSQAYAARGLPTPEERTIKGALGAVGIVLRSGKIFYGLPKSGPLADSAYSLPGSLRVRDSDLDAIRAVLLPGMSVYFY